MSRKITIEPVTRVEGHGKVTIVLGDDGKIQESRLHIVEFRGFEKFIQGRPFWEVPVLVQRLCGICPVSHHLAAAKALDQVVAGEDGISPVAEKMRRLMHYGQIFQSHALHFFHLSSPDLLFGMDANPHIRNVLGVAAEHRELARRGVLMRKFGQEIIAKTAGKKIHGTGAIPGGINRAMTREEAAAFLDPEIEQNVDTMIQWATEAVEFFKEFRSANQDFIDTFASYPSAHLSLVRPDGALDLYDGVLRAIDAEGKTILDDVEPDTYHQHITEEVKSWTYMKFPFLKKLGPEKGWYRVGPLARLNTCDFIPTQHAQRELDHFRSINGGRPSHMTMHTHWARLIETLHAAEVIKELLQDPELFDDSELVRRGTRSPEGVGVIEAPRGTLIHHYRVAPDDLIEMANLIVSTTHNNTPMNEAVRQAAMATVEGKETVEEGALNSIEAAIRAYDPCLSCATHAIGRMPLQVELFRGDTMIESKFRS